MKILTIIKHLNYGGAFKAFIWMSEALATKGHDVTMLTYGKPRYDYSPQKIKWVQFDVEDKGVYKVVKAVRAYIKENTPDVSISFLLDANIVNIIACIGLGTKSITCERNDPYKPHYYKLRFLKPLFRFADGAVHQLPKVQEFYSMIPGETAVIPNPVKFKYEGKIKPFKERNNEIVTLGRLKLFQKRHDILFKAFALFLNKHPEYILKIYGDGADELKEKELVRELGLSERIIFAGVTDDPLNSIKDSKIYAFTSDFEGIPNALIEGMSVGLPCVSTDCRPGGANLVLGGGEYGILVPKGDINGVAEAFSYLADHPDEADRIGLSGKKSLDRFSEDKIIDMWENYIRKVHYAK